MELATESAMDRYIQIIKTKRVFPYTALTFSVRHLNAIKSTAGRSFLRIKPLPALQLM
jgi:hypothetical protein